jgi:flagella basal body P-ring formation protein FlgA
MNAWLVFFSMIAHPAGCSIVANDRVFGADLAKALPAFANKIPGGAVIGYSPLPGAQRIFNFAQLQRMGAPYGVTVPPGAEACFEWSLQPLTEEVVRGAIRETLQLPNARVDVLSISGSPAPAGKVNFPLPGLLASTITGPDTPVTWRGEVLYQGSRKFSISARVRISAMVNRVVATQLILPGKTVAPDQVKIQAYDDFPLRNDTARDLAEVVGRMTRRAIGAGIPVFRADLIEPFQVQRGDLVEVTAIAGAAELHVPALAETPGRQGDLITLKNTRSGKIFRARIEGRDRALVMVWPVRERALEQNQPATRMQ